LNFHNKEHHTIFYYLRSSKLRVAAPIWLHLPASTYSNLGTTHGPEDHFSGIK